MTIERHDEEIRKNLLLWEAKPVLRQVYREFHRLIADHLTRRVPGSVVELGSGIGNIKEVIPDCVRTDLFPHPWLDRTENAYRLTCTDGSVSNLILFDVFHHLEYPGTALAESRRVLATGGRVLIFDPFISLLGLLVYGVAHAEPLAPFEPIRWTAPDGWTPDQLRYFAASSRATRIFFDRRYRKRLSLWQIVACPRLAALPYVLSGGYSRPQLYPDSAMPNLSGVSRLLDALPWLLATRVLVVLEKL